MPATNATRSAFVGSAGCSGGAVGEAKVMLIQLRGSRRSWLVRQTSKVG